MGHQIMIYDDDEMICSLLRRVLSGKGHDVTTYSNPTEFPFTTKELPLTEG